MRTNGCSVVFYHYVRDSEQTAFPGIKACRVADFGAQVEWLAGRYQVVDYDLFARALEAGRPLDQAALLTFDDGFQDHFTGVLPALKTHGIRGLFFLAGATLSDSPRLLNVHKTHFLLARLGPTRFGAEVNSSLTSLAGDTGLAITLPPDVYRYDAQDEGKIKHLLNYELPLEVTDRILDDLFNRHLGDPKEFAAALYLTPTMIREMAAAGMTFGFHTETHPVLSRLSRHDQRCELIDGVEQIMALTGQPSVPFCYPYGHSYTYNADTLELLAEAGYSMAFNTIRRAADVTSDDRFELPRFDTRDLPFNAGSRHDA